ncbi:MAG: hypothetical protein IJF78_09210 [Clostridia bacterium]|nr:hypothetical protein [Clostridia bacterium]
MATEIERKFLIRLPDFEAIPKCRVQAMTQTYLNILPDDPGLERRVRWIAENGQNRFVYTEKRSISSGTAAVRQEDEWEISAEEYADKLAEAFSQLTKVRHSFPYAGHIVEIDVYPYDIGGDAMVGLAVMEIEMADENEEIQLPPFLEVLRELTGTREFSNKALAKRVR